MDHRGDDSLERGGELTALVRVYRVYRLPDALEQGLLAAGLGQEEVNAQLRRLAHRAL